MAIHSLKLICGSNGILLTAVSAIAVGMFLAPAPAAAQFVCAGSATGAEPQTGASGTATGALSVACGTNASATADSTAFGDFAIAQIGSVAVGNSAIANNAGAVAVGKGTNAFSNAGADSTAVGTFSTASGDYSIALGGAPANIIATSASGTRVRTHYSHQMTAAARAIAPMKFLMLRSKRVAMRRQSLSRQNMRSMMLRCL